MTREPHQSIQDDFYDLGVERGRAIASWIDVPQFGDHVPREIDWIGIEQILSKDDALEAFKLFAQAAEENSRQFSPFEHTAKAINESDEPDQNWDAFNQGIDDGIDQHAIERLSHYSEEDFTQGAQEA